MFFALITHNLIVVIGVNHGNVGDLIVNLILFLAGVVWTAQMTNQGLVVQEFTATSRTRADQVQFLVLFAVFDAMYHELKGHDLLLPPSFPFLIVEDPGGKRPLAS